MGIEILLNLNSACTLWGYGRDDSNEAKKTHGLMFDLCNEDGEKGLTWDELKNCEVSFSLS